jgi:hypothetical protein
MEWLVLALGVSAAALAWGFARSAVLAASDCHQHAMRLAAQRGRVVTLEGASESLTARLAKVERRVGTLASNARSEAEEMGRATSRGGPPSVLIDVDDAEPCPNWSVAQRDGPSSEAAACQCPYCLAKRHQRALARGEALASYPKAHADKVRETERRS